MTEETDAYIQEKLDKIKGAGHHEVEATLLLAQKLGDVERAINGVEGALGAIFSVIDAMLGKMDRP